MISQFTQMVLVFWVLVQALGFALPAHSEAVGQCVSAQLAREHSQPENHHFDSFFLPPLAYDGELAMATMVGWSDLSVPTQAAIGYDYFLSSLFRKADIEAVSGCCIQATD